MPGMWQEKTVTPEKKTPITRDSDGDTGRRSNLSVMQVQDMTNNHRVKCIAKYRQTVVQRHDHILGSVNSPWEKPAPDLAAGDNG
jgi:hypothetical protein